MKKNKRCLVKNGGRGMGGREGVVRFTILVIASNISMHGTADDTSAYPTRR